MKIGKALDLIDAYEENHGNAVAIVRACDVMTGYVEHLFGPLPIRAAIGMMAALEHRSGKIDPDDLSRTIRELAAFIRQSGISAVRHIVRVCRAGWSGGHRRSWHLEVV